MDLQRLIAWYLHRGTFKGKPTREQIFRLAGDKQNKKGKPPKITNNKFLSLINQLENPDKSWQPQ